MYIYPDNKTSYVGVADTQSILVHTYIDLYDLGWILFIKQMHVHHARLFES